MASCEIAERHYDKSPKRGRMERGLAVLGPQSRQPVDKQQLGDTPATDLRIQSVAGVAEYHRTFKSPLTMETVGSNRPGSVEHAWAGSRNVTSNLSESGAGRPLPLSWTLTTNPSGPP